MREDPWCLPIVKDTNGTSIAECAKVDKDFLCGSMRVVVAIYQRTLTTRLPSPRGIEKMRNHTKGHSRTFLHGRVMTQKQYEHEIEKLQRLCDAVEVFSVRNRYEHMLLRQGHEPRFRVSWEKLKKVIDNPLVGFKKLVERLHRCAQTDSDEAVKAFQAVSIHTKETHELSPQESTASNDVEPRRYARHARKERSKDSEKPEC